MSKWPKINRKNWRSLTRENKKIFKELIRDIHDEILDDFATCQRLDDIKFGSMQWISIPFLNGNYIVKIDHNE